MRSELAPLILLAAEPDEPEDELRDADEECDADEVDEPAECDESADGGRWSAVLGWADNSDASDELPLPPPIGRPSSSKSTSAR